MPVRSSPTIAKDPEESSAPLRPRHLVDRALEYARLVDDGWTAAQIVKRRRRSQGYVSIVVRLGKALQGLPEPEIAALRSRRVTYKVAQKVMKAGITPEAVRKELRYALGGFSSYNVDRRKYRGNGKRPLATHVAPAPVSSWQDRSLASRDPIAFVDELLAHLQAQHSMATQILNAAITARNPAPVPLAGQSLRAIGASMAAARAGGAAMGMLRPEDRAAREKLSAIGRALVDPDH